VLPPASHPFISFEFTADKLPPATWLALGEAMSKCEHLAGVPLKPQAAEQLLGIYLVRGVQATTAIEGNTLSTDEVKKIVEKGTAGVSESRQYLEREVQNVMAAIREIDVNLQAGYKPPITEERICQLNEQVLRGIPDKPEVIPGRYREHDVTVGPYRAPHWTLVPDLMRNLVKWMAELRDETTDSRREERFLKALLTAVLGHLYIAWIHPFGNGNGRVARLIEVQILSESGVVPIVATNLLSDHYNKTRSEYYRHLDLAQRDVAPFIQYALFGFRDELREQIATVRVESLQIHWESHVFEVFAHRTPSAARDRQREVALTMPEAETLTPEQATELSTSLAKKYGRCGERTPARDMNQLAKLGLVERTGRRRYRVRREIIEAFIPPVAV
jgi:Fic family protein